MDRRFLLGVLAFAFALALVAVLWASTDDARAPRSSRPPPSPPRPAPAMTRVALPAPPDVDRAPAPEEGPDPVPITGEDRRLMNIAVDDLITAARTDCLVPWLGRDGDGEPVEVVFDAVLNDGRLVDVGIRSMRLDLPSDVLQCVADRAWYAEWPEWELPGELRLQRSVEVKPPRPEP